MFYPLYSIYSFWQEKARKIEEGDWGLGVGVQGLKARRLD